MNPNPIPGLIGELPDDPRVKEALEKVEGKNLEVVAADALLTSNSPAPRILEDYGIKMRPQNLMHGVMISRIMALGTVDEYYQPWIWLWSLCAPLREIYLAIDKAKIEGIPALMEEVHEWFNKSKLPQDITKEVMDMVARTFLLASKLAPQPGEDEEGGVKKNATLGGSSLPTC